MPSEAWVDIVGGMAPVRRSGLTDTVGNVARTAKPNQQSGNVTNRRRSFRADDEDPRIDERTKTNDETQAQDFFLTVANSSMFSSLRGRLYLYIFPCEKYNSVGKLCRGTHRFVFGRIGEHGEAGGGGGGGGHSKRRRRETVQEIKV